MNPKSLPLAAILLCAPLLLQPASGALPPEELSFGSLCLGERICLDADPCRSLAACDQLPCDPSTATCVVPAPCDGAADCGPPTVTVSRLPGARACAGGATWFSFRLDTGVTSTGASLATGSVDPLWKVSPTAPASGPAYAKDPAVSPSAWVQHPTARWINPYPGATTGGPLSDFAYGASFVVPAQAYQVTVAGQYAADNSAVVTLGATSYVSPPDAFGAWNPVSWSNVQPGVHTLAADVHNRPSSLGSPTPTGLLVEVAVQGFCKPAGPIVGTGACSGGATSFHYLLNTGLDPTGAPIPAGLDPHWRVTTSPAGYAGPAASHGVNPTLPYGAWISDPASAWINHDPTDVEGPGGSYGYQLSYFVPANAYAVQLSGRFAADNEAIVSTTSTVQSTLLGTAPAGSNGGAWYSIAPFSPGPGYHTLDALVTNYRASFSPDTPTGLNVQISVRGLCMQTAVDDAWNALA